MPSHVRTIFEWFEVRFFLRHLPFLFLLGLFRPVECFETLVEHKTPLRPRQFVVHFHFILRLKNFSPNRSLTNLRANRECHRPAPRARKPPAQPIVCPAAVRYSHARLDSCRSDGS